MVWPLNHRRQVPFGRRQTPFIAPPALANAPIELLRSQLYPMDPNAMVPGIAQAMDGGYPPQQWLPIRMVQQQWKRDGYHNQWLPYDSAFQGYMQALRTGGSTLQSIRRHSPPVPTLPWDMLRAELAAQLEVSSGPEVMRHPLARGVPYPERLPSESFAMLEDLESYASSQRYQELAARRNAAMERVRELDYQYGRFTEPQR